jgi:fermentation-respiration switch protein FrsA (DUF1100 family)
MAWPLILVIVLSSILLLLLLVLLLTAFFIARMIYSPLRYSRDDQKAFNKKMGWDNGVEVFDHSTPITFTLKDGYIISGDYDLVKDSKKFCILLHGHQTSREGARRYALIFKELGYSTIVYDERGHGDNVRCKVSMGFHESHDLAEIIDQVYAKFGKDIYLGLQGVSMGAATVLLSTALQQKVAFIVSDCAFANLKGVIKDIIKNKHLPSFPLLQFINMDLSLFAHFSFKDTDALSAIKSNEIPTLFIHGESDAYVHVSNVKALYEADKGYKEVYTFPGAAHASSITVDRARYKELVSNFLNKIKKE